MDKLFYVVLIGVCYMCLSVVRGESSSSNEEFRPVTVCLDDCAKQYYPPGSDKQKVYAACRHGCRLAQHTYNSNNNNNNNANANNANATAFHVCYAFCQKSYADKALTEQQEACIYSCKSSFQQLQYAIVRPSSQPPQSPSLKCQGPLYGSLEGMKCMAYMPMWQFNYITNKCEEFVYGGCPEVANMFETLQGCEAECGAIAAAHAGHHHVDQMQQKLIKSVDEKPPKCLSPTYEVVKNIGGLECDNFMEKFQFNYDEGKCEAFQFGGCPDVDNMFETFSECQIDCSMFTAPPTTPSTTLPVTSVNAALLPSSTPSKPTDGKKSSATSVSQSLSNAIFAISTVAIVVSMMEN